MGSHQLYSLSWGEFGTSLTSTVQILRGQSELVDVTLTAGGRIFPAHKLVLSAASPLLMELLKSTHCHHPVVMLAGITAPDLEALLQFVYQGEVSVDPNQLPSLLQAAHCLDIQALSPQTLTTEKTMAQVSVPLIMNDGLREINPSLPSLSRDITSPLLPVRKRKRKQNRNTETDSINWTVTEEVGGVMMDDRPLEQSVDNTLLSNAVDDPMKNEMMEDQHCNGEPSGTKKLVSDLPVECTICGVTLRQSRNLRRHMELIHLKAENGGKPRKSLLLNDESKKPDEKTVQGVQSVQSIQTLAEVGDPVENTVIDQPAGPSRLPPPPPPPPPPHILNSPPMYHSSVECDPYTHQHSHSHAHNMQFTNDVFRQHQTELLRGAGLYADTREHCATE